MFNCKKNHTAKSPRILYLWSYKSHTYALDRVETALFVFFINSREIFAGGGLFLIDSRYIQILAGEITFIYLFSLSQNYKRYIYRAWTSIIVVWTLLLPSLPLLQECIVLSLLLCFFCEQVGILHEFFFCRLAHVLLAARELRRRRQARARKQGVTTRQRCSPLCSPLYDQWECMFHWKLMTHLVHVKYDFY